MITISGFSLQSEPWLAGHAGIFWTMHGMPMQVYTTKQWAILMVQSYPYLGVMETHLEVMAADRGEPSRAELLASSQPNTLAAEWRHLNNYLESIASKNSHDYIPFGMGEQVQPVQSVYPATAGTSFAAEPASGMNLLYL